MSQEIKGQCLCGAVRFTVSGDSAGVVLCHCGQCRAWTSGPFMIRHFTGGVVVEQGFCSRCGSSLFYRQKDADQKDGGDDWAVSVGALEQSEHRIVAHAWVEDKPDWYDFADDAPRMTPDQFVKAREDGIL